jgi:hypothetical protein
MAVAQRIRADAVRLPLRWCVDGVHPFHPDPFMHPSTVSFSPVSVCVSHIENPGKKKNKGRKEIRDRRMDGYLEGEEE